MEGKRALKTFAPFDAERETERGGREGDTREGARMAGSGGAGPGQTEDGPGRYTRTVCRVARAREHDVGARAHGCAGWGHCNNGTLLAWLDLDHAARRRRGGRGAATDTYAAHVPWRRRRR